MIINDLFIALQDTGFATSIREADSLFPWIECVHVLAITFVVGSIAGIDLRLLGLRATDRPMTALAREVLPWTWGAFVIAAASGFLMFASNALKYAGNFAFQLKIALLILAGINMLAFHLFTYRNVSSWDHARRPPRRARIAGALSLALWIAIVTFGRIIGFTATPVAN